MKKTTKKTTVKKATVKKTVKKVVKKATKKVMPTAHQVTKTGFMHSMMKMWNDMTK